MIDPRDAVADMLGVVNIGIACSELLKRHFFCDIYSAEVTGCKLLGPCRVDLIDAKISVPVFLAKKIFCVVKM